MLSWLRKSKPEPAVEAPKHPTGIFSTDIELLARTRGAEFKEVAQALARTFQKSPEDFKLLTPEGAAMDWGDSVNDMSQLKLSNNFGQGMPWGQLFWYSSQGFIGYQNAAMISQQWLVDKACTMPAKDAVRNGYEISVNDGVKIDPEVLDFIRQRDKHYKIKNHCMEFLRKGRIFGIRIAKFNIDYADKNAYEKPFNPDGIRPGSYRGITQIDPYWITPELDYEAVTPGTQNFYEPTWWRINGQRIHRTHLVIMRNSDVPDILKPTYLYGGIPVPQLIAERVYAAERTANEGPMLALSKRLFSYKVDLTEAAGNIELIQQKIQAWSALMNNFGIKVIGEGEEINQYDTSLNDLDAVIMTQYQLVAAASGVPATKLLGTSPKGFNSEGEYEAKSYHELLESCQEHDLSPLVDRHHLCVIRSDVSKKFGKNDFTTSAVWAPVDSPTAKEQAEINQTKANTDKTLAESGAIDGQDIRNRIIADPGSGYNGIADVVPGGPGDEDNDTGEDSSEEFDPVRGTYKGARLVTHQKYLNQEKVDEKIKNKDFMVNVTPEFFDEGKKYRMIIDGHHSLAAALQSKVTPVFVSKIPHNGEIINAATKAVTDEKDDLQ